MSFFQSIIRFLGHWRWVIRYEFIPVCKARFRYPEVIKRVRQKAAKGEKIQVVFLVNEISKWKAQSLYDWMKQSNCFEPKVVLTFAENIKDSLSVEEQRKKYNIAHVFFKKRSIDVTEVYIPETNNYIPVSELNADVLFYFQPWGVPKEYMPYEAAKDVLTCYIPYYVPNYGDIDIDCRQPFHRTLWTYFVLNEEWASLFRNACRSWMSIAQYLGLGHTMLDCFHQDMPCKELIIYAPHWTLDVPGNENFENYSTFHLNGHKILQYAQNHTNYHWVFKPHPDLKGVLRKIGWSTEKINNYYDAWGKIGTVCETGDYPTLFMESRLMITDCGSFLTEYACTGNPILHLISPTCKLVPFPQSKQLYDLYYQAHDENELFYWLDELVVKKLDPRREQRMAMVQKMKLRGNNAAEAIGQWLKEQLFV